MPIDFDKIVSDLKANPAIPLAGVAAGVGLFFLYKRGNLGGGSVGGNTPTDPGSSGTPGAPSGDSGLADQVASLAQQLAQTTAADQKAIADQASGQAGFAKQLTDFVNGALGQVSDAINGQNSGVQGQIDAAVGGLQSQIQSELAQLNTMYSSLGQPGQNIIPLSLANKTPQDLINQINHGNLSITKDLIAKTTKAISDSVSLTANNLAPNQPKNLSWLSSITKSIGTNASQTANSLAATRASQVTPARISQSLGDYYRRIVLPSRNIGRGQPTNISRPNPGFDPRAYLANLRQNFSAPPSRTTPSPYRNYHLAPQPRSSQTYHSFRSRTNTFAQSQQDAYKRLTGRG